jgi:hypothetical protein
MEDKTREPKSFQEKVNYRKRKQIQRKEAPEV